MHVVKKLSSHGFCALLFVLGVNSVTVYQGLSNILLTRSIEPVEDQCWNSEGDGGPHWSNIGSMSEGIQSTALYSGTVLADAPIIYSVFIEECGSQSLNLTAVLIIFGYWNAKRGMQSTDEIPGYSMIIFHIKRRWNTSLYCTKLNSVYFYYVNHSSMLIIWSYMVWGRLKSILQQNNTILMFYHKPLDLIMIVLGIYLTCNTM